MSCKGIAASSCPSATGSVCVCNCEGACHGSGLPLSQRPQQVRSLRQQDYALLQAISILRVINPHQTRRRSFKGFPHRNARLRRWLRRARIFWGGSFWGIQESMLEPTGHLAKELVAILNQMEDGEATGSPPPALSRQVIQEINEIFTATDSDTPGAGGKE